METEHSLERIFLTLTDSCPLPVGWACLRQPGNERNILFAHVSVDQRLQVECDRTILLTPMITEKSSCLVKVTFTESSSCSTPSNSTSLLMRDLTDVSNLLRASFKGGAAEPESSLSLEQKPTGSPLRTTGAKRKADDEDDEVQAVESSFPKKDKSPADGAASVTAEAVTMALTPSGYPSKTPFSSGISSSESSSSTSSSFNPMLFNSSSQSSSSAFKYNKDKDRERPYKCPECDKTFVRGNHLKDHMRLHAGETYECPVCKYECILQTKFTHHLTSHNNQGPFPCHQCGKAFERAHDLARHLPVDHKIDTGFRLSHFKNNFSPAQFKDKSAASSNLLSIAGRPPCSSKSSNYHPRLPQSSFSNLSKPDFPSISSTHNTITDFGNGTYADMQRLMKLYGGTEEDDGDDSVIPLDDDDDDEVQLSTVKSLDDEFGDDAILVE